MTIKLNDYLAKLPPLEQDGIAARTAELIAKVANPHPQEVCQHPLEGETQAEK